MTYKILWSETAEAEADAAFLWLSRISPDFAERWYTELLDAVNSLEDFPKRCALAPENSSISAVEVRHLIYRQRRTIYRIIFCIVGEDTVRILYVRHGSQQNSRDADASET